jgi:AcrR family transcriptional regulator
MNYLSDRRLEEKERRRGDILDAAESVAAGVGIEQMTMDEVARRARLSRALLYVYFQDKSDLLFALCERALQLLHQRFAEASARQSVGIAQVEACGRAYLAFAHEFPVHFDALARFQAHESEVNNVGQNEGACMLAGDKVHGVMIESIQRGIGDGSIRADIGEPALVAMTLWGFMHGIIQLSATKANVLAHNGIGTATLTNHALALAMRSIARLS